MGKYDRENVAANEDLAAAFASYGASAEFVDRIRKHGTDVPEHLTSKSRDSQAGGRVASTAMRDSAPAPGGAEGDAPTPESSGDAGFENGRVQDAGESSGEEQEGFVEEVADEFETWFRKNRRPPNPMTVQVQADIQRMLLADPDYNKRLQKPRREDPGATKKLALPSRRTAVDEDAAVYGRRGPERWVQWRLSHIGPEDRRRASETATSRAGDVPTLTGVNGEGPEERAAKLEEWRGQLQAQREAREAAEREERARRRVAQKVLAEFAEERTRSQLDQWVAKRRKDVARGARLRQERTGHFNVHNGGTVTLRASAGRLHATAVVATRDIGGDMSTSKARTEAMRYFTGVADGPKVPKTSILGL